MFYITFLWKNLPRQNDTAFLTDYITDTALHRCKYHTCQRVTSDLYVRSEVLLAPVRTASAFLQQGKRKAKRLIPLTDQSVLWGILVL